MDKFDVPLNNIKIASPCPADWNAMVGDERRRYCGECKLNVYNLSGMTRREAENLLINSEGRLCVRFYQRADGTVLIKDCPVGWQLLKKRVSKTATAFASLFFGIFSGLSYNALFGESKKTIPTVTGMITVEDLQNNNNVVAPAFSVIEPTGDYEPNVTVRGRISNIEEVRQKVIRKRRR